MAKTEPPAPRVAATERLLQAAREVFAERGWRGATTKEIAARAAVSEVLIFRYYGSKAELVARAVYGPITSFLEDFARRWEQEPADRARSDEDLVGEYVRALLGFVTDNRPLFLSLLQVLLEPHDSVDLAGLRTGIDQLLRVVTDDASTFLAERRHRPADAEILVRTSLLLITSTAAFLPFTYPPGAAPPADDKVVDELTAFLVAGIRNRPDGDERDLPT